MLEKLTDYMIAVMLSFALVVSMFFEPVMSNFADMQDSKKEISQLSSQLKSMESELNLYKKAISRLANKENISLAMKVNSLELVADSNAKILADINGLIAKDPEKILAIKDINTKYDFVIKQLDKIDNNIQKNEDRLFSNIQWAGGLIFTLLLFVAAYRFSQSKKNESQSS